MVLRLCQRVMRSSTGKVKEQFTENLRTKQKNLQLVKQRATLSAELSKEIMKARLLEVYQADEVGERKRYLKGKKRDRQREMYCTNGLRQQDWEKSKGYLKPF